MPCAKKGGTHSLETRKKMSNYRTGKPGPTLGMHLSEAHKEKLRVINKGKILSEEHKKKIGNSNAGKVRSKEICKKLRLSHLSRISNALISGGQLKPSYNKNACEIFEEINRELGWLGQHAENGGEFYIKELGYWVDYYERNLNLVIEYDEKYHTRQIDKDKKRQQEIEEGLKCKFYRIKETDNWKDIING